MRASFKLEGGRELERALGKLDQKLAARIAFRAMRPEANKIAKLANAYSNFSTETGSDRVFKVSTRAERAGRKGASELRLFVGADVSTSSGPLAHIFEYGTGPRYTGRGSYRGEIAPQPALRPAWDQAAPGAFERMGARIRAEIEKALK